MRVSQTQPPVVCGTDTGQCRHSARGVTSAHEMASSHAIWPTNIAATLILLVLLQQQPYLGARADPVYWKTAAHMRKDVELAVSTQAKKIEDFIAEKTKDEVRCLCASRVLRGPPDSSAPLVTLPPPLRPHRFVRASSLIGPYRHAAAASPSSSAARLINSNSCLVVVRVQQPWLP